MAVKVAEAQRESRPQTDDRQLSRRPLDDRRETQIDFVATNDPAFERRAAIEIEDDR